MSEPTTSTPITGTSLADIEKAQPAVEQFLDKHQIKLVALALLLIVAALVYVVQDKLKQGQEETAGALLVSKTETADLERIAKDFSATAAAGSSKILLAEKQWEEGKKDEAITTLRGFVDSAEVHPARASAIASLAAKLHAQGKTSDAEKLFTELTQDADAGYLTAYAWIALGDIATKKGDLDAAEKAYATVEKDFSKTTYAQDATKRRLQMKAESPVVVAAPIKLPDTKITDGEGAPATDLEIKDMLDTLKKASEGTSTPSRSK